ncbi:mechanosensitive ion channel [Flavobacteriaceae bacterium]|jgi:small conductance mechanosensitive channel|nr:mechanosensitive ion channel [Flavobacteriaceae bacterium]MDG1384633.1 mechanosensitive ion channel [Flavobacteriaceae bacterium]
MEKYLTLLKDLLLEYSPRALYALILLIVGLYAIKFIIRLIIKLLRARKVDDTLQAFLGNLLGWGLKGLLIVAVISKLGVDTTALAAVMAAAGLGLGLALQGALGNFAGGVLIILFKPFKVGDLVDAQGEIGTVKDIDIFTTQILTPTNKRVIIPNGTLANSNITNLSAEGKLRVDLTIGVGYDEDIKKTKDVLMSVLTSHPKVLQEPLPSVDVSELADSSVNFSVKSWSTVEDYWTVYFGVTENCKLALDAAGIEIPYPHTVEIKKTV